MTPYDLLGLVAVILSRTHHPLAAPGGSVVERTQRRDRAGVSRSVHLRGRAAWLLITFVARTYYIPSASMVPTLEVHDVLLVDKFEYRFPQTARRRRRGLSAADSDAGRFHQARDRPARRAAATSPAASSTSTAKRSTSRTSPPNPTTASRSRTTALRSTTDSVGTRCDRLRRTSRPSRSGRRPIRFRRIAT